MQTPREGDLWSFTSPVDGATRFLRVTSVETGLVHGYAWWDESSSGRPTRMAMEVFTKSSSKWRLAEEAGA